MQIEELEGYLEQLKADLKVAQHRHQAAVEEVRIHVWRTEFCAVLNKECSELFSWRRAEPSRAEPRRSGQSETKESETDQLEGGGPIAFRGQLTVFFVHLLSHKWLLRGRPDFEIIGLASYWLIYDWRAWFRKPITKSAGNTCAGAIIAKSIFLLLWLQCKRNFAMSVSIVYSSTRTVSFLSGCRLRG